MAKVLTQDHIDQAAAKARKQAVSEMTKKMAGALKAVKLPEDKSHAKAVKAALADVKTIFSAADSGAAA